MYESSLFSGIEDEDEEQPDMKMHSKNTKEVIISIILLLIHHATFQVVFFPLLDSSYCRKNYYLQMPFYSGQFSLI